MVDAPLTLGIDLGTSGTRACLVDAAGRAVAWGKAPGAALREPRPGWREQRPAAWWDSLRTAVAALPVAARQQVAALAVDGTSGTVLLADESGRPCSPALRYDDRRATAEAAAIARVAPAESGAHGASSGLAKLLWLGARHGQGAALALTQADWINGRLTGRWGRSDENNALKLGYDPLARRWPDWLAALDLPREWLPAVQPPGTPLAPLADGAAAALGLPAAIPVAAGTTDSIAAFLATGAGAPGDAVTSLGSTLAIKLVTGRPVFDPAGGVYSHRLWSHWLAGGASNSGGAVLRRYFSDAELAALSARIDPERDSGLDYYPLPGPGERFPVADPDLPPRLDPRPADPVRFLHGLLEGMARIERRGYQRLAELGAPWPRQVLTVGGGAANPAWRRLRERILGCPVRRARHGEAAYGAALLARRALGGHPHP